MRAGLSRGVVQSEGSAGEIPKIIDRGVSDHGYRIELLLTGRSSDRR